MWSPSWTLASYSDLAGSFRTKPAAVTSGSLARKPAGPKSSSPRLRRTRQLLDFFVCHLARRPVLESFHIDFFHGKKQCKFSCSTISRANLLCKYKFYTCPNHCGAIFCTNPSAHCKASKSTPEPSILVRTFHLATHHFFASASWFPTRPRALPAFLLAWNMEMSSELSILCWN